MPSSEHSHGLAVAGAGEMLALVREGRATTRAELVEETGLARSTVAQRVDALVQTRHLRAEQLASSSGGRPPTVLALNERLGHVLAVDLGATAAHLALCDLGAEILAEQTHPLEVERGPEEVLGWLVERFGELCLQAGCGEAELLAVGLGIPAPVDFAAGRAISPPIMPGWSDFPVADWLRERLEVPVLVDNDANVMALGEYRLNWAEERDLLFVKVATGIGCGIIAAGEVYRGAEGAAGDIGHVRCHAAGERICGCGQRGCLEALAGGRALAAELSAVGVHADSAREVAAALLAAEPRAVALARDAGREIGEVLASIVNFFNPSTIVVGGTIADASEDLLAGVREAVYRRSLPLATRRLEISRSFGAERAGVIGAAVMAIDRYLRPEAVDARLELALRKGAGSLE
ncbi:MAG TPA: ROK family protein [Solirubrobacterales bacterium]|nr:ROK family protein [Solirubrobacterales bacterium]